MSLIHLASRAVLKVEGEDAKNFRQVIITNDTRKISPDGLLYAALLTPQGKYLFDFFLLENEGAVLLECAAVRADDLLKRLAMYKLRAKVVLSKTTMHAYASDTAGLPDPRHPRMFRRLISQTPLDADTPFQAYERRRLELGIPDSEDFIPEKTFLAEFGMEQLHGVDFNKGCYVGQEVTARSKFRGEIKKCLHQVRALAGELPEPGTPILAEGKEIGQMRTAIGEIGLAVLRIEEAKQADALSTSIPAWFVQG